MAGPRQYWLLKSEPDEFSIEDLKNSKGQVVFWDGVRNFQARNYLRDQVRMGDGVFFYHSGEEAGIAGEAVVVRKGYPDHTVVDAQSKINVSKKQSEKPIWYMIDIQYIRSTAQLISLRRLKEVSALSDMVLFRHSRLSVQPVSYKEWKAILSFSEWQK